MILRPVITCLLLLSVAYSQRTVVEPTMLGPALAALGYEGSLNMSTDEARRLGSAIGCDFFVIGKAEVLSRSGQARELHKEALLAVMMVDGRTGKLAVFDLIAEEARSSESAIAAITKALGDRVSGYVDQMTQFRAARESVTNSPIQNSEIERIEEMPVEGSLQAVGFKAPEFLGRVKPEYTAEAERADVNATIEAMVVLRSSGEVGDVEITRWAGFGLEESALRAIRRLQFKPATRNGKLVSVRAMIRYNFRRVGQ